MGVISMKNFLIGYQDLDYVNQDGKHIKGTKVDLLSADYSNGVGVGLNSYFTNDSNIINTLHSLPFEDNIIYSVDIDFSINNCRVNLKALRKIDELLLD